MSGQARGSLEAAGRRPGAQLRTTTRCTRELGEDTATVVVEDLSPLITRVGQDTSRGNLVLRRRSKSDLLRGSIVRHLAAQLQVR